eukprot:scaffold7471_cov49-Phaeocystis_antarctica.AAC.1
MRAVSIIIASTSVHPDPSPNASGVALAENGRTDRGRISHPRPAAGRHEAVGRPAAVRRCRRLAVGPIHVASASLKLTLTLVGALFKRRWILGERPDHRFEFLERYGSCRVVRVSKVPGSDEVARGVPKLRGTVSGCLSHTK